MKKKMEMATLSQDSQAQLPSMHSCMPLCLGWHASTTSRRQRKPELKADESSSEDFNLVQSRLISCRYEVQLLQCLAILQIHIRSLESSRTSLVLYRPSCSFRFIGTSVPSDMRRSDATNRKLRFANLCAAAVWTHTNTVKGFRSECRLREEVGYLQVQRLRLRPLRPTIATNRRRWAVACWGFPKIGYPNIVP